MLRRMYPIQNPFTRKLVYMLPSSQNIFKIEGLRLEKLPPKPLPISQPGKYLASGKREAFYASKLLTEIS